MIIFDVIPISNNFEIYGKKKIPAFFFQISKEDFTILDRSVSLTQQTGMDSAVN